jgi:hypothetical protein
MAARKEVSIPRPQPIGRKDVEDGSKARYQEQTRQTGQSHGSMLAMPGPEPWQSCRVASISSGRSCSRHAQKLNPCPPPAAPRSTSPASYCIHLLPRPSIFPRSALPCLLLLLPASRSCIYRHRSVTPSSTTIHHAIHRKGETASQSLLLHRYLLSPTAKLSHQSSFRPATRLRCAD